MASHSASSMRRIFWQPSSSRHAVLHETAGNTRVGGVQREGKVRYFRVEVHVRVSHCLGALAGVADLAVDCRQEAVGSGEGARGLQGRAGQGRAGQARPADRPDCWWEQGAAYRPAAARTHLKLPAARLPAVPAPCWDQTPPNKILPAASAAPPQPPPQPRCRRAPTRRLPPPCRRPPPLPLACPLCWRGRPAAARCWPRRRCRCPLSLAAWRQRGRPGS